MTIPYVATANTKLLYHLDGNSNDSSGNSNNGTDSNITYNASYGKFDQGAYFNGTTSKISFTTTGFPTGANPITISAWVKPNGFNAFGYPIFVGASYNDQALGIGLVGNTAIRAVYYGNDLDYNVVLTSGVYVNIMTIYDGTVLRLYLNGLQVASGNRSLNLTAGGLHEIGGTSAPFVGSLDEIIVENRAWSAGEVFTYYMGGGQVIWWSN